MKLGRAKKVLVIELADRRSSVERSHSFCVNIVWFNLSMHASVDIEATDQLFFCTVREK